MLYDGDTESRQGVNVTLDTVNINTKGEGASGVKVTSITNSDLKETKFIGTNININTTGDNAYAVMLEEKGIADFTGGSLVTSGNGSHGAYLADMGDYTNGPPAVTFNGTAINTTAASNASGVYMVDSGDVTLTDSVVKSSDASIKSAFTQSDQEQNIKIAGSDLTVNNGTLLQVNRTGDGQDGNVNLTLGDGTVAHGDIDDRSAEGSGKTNLTLSKLATWVGEFLGVAGDTKVEEGANYTSR